MSFHKKVAKYLNIKLSWRGSFEVRMAGVLVWGVHDEDQGQLRPRDTAAKEAREGDSVGVYACRLHWCVPQCLSGAALPHDHHSHHLVPPACKPDTLATTTIRQET